jgi:hypothetical protein
MEEFVACKVGCNAYDIGTLENWYALGATISYHLEPDGWGTKYPELMNSFFQCKLARCHAEKVLKDLQAIREELKWFPPSAVVWDFENPGFRPPQGTPHRENVTDLSNYFVSKYGRNVFDGIIMALDALIQDGGVLKIVRMQSGNE